MLRLIVVAALLAAANAGGLSRLDEREEKPTIADYPYQVTIWALRKAIQPGVIISPTHVLTSARTISTRQFYWHYHARVGSSHQLDGGRLEYIYKFFHHPKFDHEKIGYDITVGKLIYPIEFGANVQPIRMVPVNEEVHQGDVLTVSSWDSTSGEIKTMKSANIAVVNQELCQNPENGNPILDHMICGRGNPRGIDNDDRGAPLVNSERQLVGIASFSIEDQHPRDYPGVFTSVANQEIRDFIEERIINA